jgi:6-phosphogluconolactonase (cycloisomerase 2 family)
MDSHGVHPRTFHIDPSGRLMAVAHITGAVLSLFRIGEDGGLHFARAYDIDVGQRTMWWMGMVEQAE